MRPFLPLVVVLLTLTGCMSWSHPSLTEEQAAVEWDSCKQELVAQYQRNTFVAASQGDLILHECMVRKGFHPGGPYTFVKMVWWPLPFD